MADEKDTKAQEPNKPEPNKPEPKTAEKKPAADKPAAKKPAAKKPGAKKPGAKQPAAKKPAAKKTPAKQTSAKEPSAEQPAADETSEEKPESDKAKAPTAKKSETSAAKPSADEFTSDPTFVRATARYVRSSPRKARLVVDHIRNESVEDARIFLQFTARHVGRDVSKVLESAVANAEHNFELDPDDLHIVKAFVDEGPTLKRWRPRAKGRATQILKRTSHITVVVSDAPANKASARGKSARKATA